MWTTADNQRVSLGIEDFKAINTAAAMRSNQLHVKYNSLKQQVCMCATKETVQEIKW